MPIFTRTFDLLRWLVPATNHFPRAHGFIVIQRLLNAKALPGNLTAVFHAQHFYLPPFAYWAPGDWTAKERMTGIIPPFGSASIRDR